jgi:hypothetical protein
VHFEKKRFLDFKKRSTKIPISEGNVIEKFGTVCGILGKFF